MEIGLDEVNSGPSPDENLEKWKAMRGLGISIIEYSYFGL
jgi:hypothetical protein